VCSQYALRRQERPRTWRSEPIVRSLQLQAALAEFIAQAADSLHADVSSGREVPFELDTQSGRGRGAPALYCYRPLTAEFIAGRFHELRRLDAYGQAADLLDAFEALDRYLIARGVELGRGRGRPSPSRVDAALLTLLQEIFDQQTDFDRSKMSHYEQRLERALERLEDSTFAAAGEVTLVASLHGLTIASQELALARGLLIAHPDALQGAPDQALGAGPLGGESGEGNHLLVVFTAQATDPRAAIAQGKEVLRELLRALRLFGDGRITLGAIAWARTGSAPWSTFALGMGGRPHGMLFVCAEQEDELRAFCNLVSRRAPHANEVAWALRRFELGCERASEYEAISDHLLALRALLGRSSELDHAGLPDGLLAARLAALCATPEQRTTLAERTLKAIALERQAIAGMAKERTSAINMARELAGHLRALLRDVVCGHLPADLGALADEILLTDEQAEAGEQQVVAREVGEQAGEQHMVAAESPMSKRGVGRITGSSSEQPLGDQAEAGEVLHVAV
jgi:hypothetical protein